MEHEIPFEESCPDVDGIFQSSVHRHKDSAQNNPKTRILVMGSSHIHRLETSILQNVVHSARSDFGTGGDIRFFGIGGARVETLRNSKQLECTLSETKPDIIILHIGSNDADSSKSASEISSDISHYVSDLKRRFKVRKFFLSQLFSRKSTRQISVASYNSKVLEINRQLRRLNSPAVTFWRHKGMMQPTSSILLNDGVHLNPVGQELFYRSMKKAVSAALYEPSP